MLLNMLKAINSVIIIGGAVKVQTMMSPSMVASLGRLAGHNCKLENMLHNIMVPIIFNHCAIRVV